MSDNESDERKYINGYASACRMIVQTCLPHIGGNSRSVESLLIERHSAVIALRRLCDEHGDNDWPDDLHLSDIIEKHLGRHIE